MAINEIDRVYGDLDIGGEQVSSNECWDIYEAGEIEAPVYPDLDLGQERVTSNECYDVTEEE